MNNFSDMGSEVQSHQDLQSVISKALSVKNKLSGDQSLEVDNDSISSVEVLKKFEKRKSCIVTLENLLRTLDEHLTDFKEVSFDIFNLTKQVERHQVLPVMTLKALTSLDLQPLYDQNKMAAFLDSVYSTYLQDVQYHNDLHGADVMQMSYYMLSNCGLSKTI